MIAPRGRRDGFLQELAKAGIDAACDTGRGRRLQDRARGAAAHGEVDEHSSPRPTAVFCGSDILAAGAIKYCHEAGIAVPSDVSIMGFDNLEIAELTTPELTTLEVPCSRHGSPRRRLHSRLTAAAQTSAPARACHSADHQRQHRAGIEGLIWDRTGSEQPLPGHVISNGVDIAAVVGRAGAVDDLFYLDGAFAGKQRCVVTTASWCASIPDGS